MFFHEKLFSTRVRPLDQIFPNYDLTVGPLRESVKECLLEMIVGSTRVLQQVPLIGLLVRPSSSLWTRRLLPTPVPPQALLPLQLEATVKLEATVGLEATQRTESDSERTWRASQREKTYPKEQVSRRTEQRTRTSQTKDFLKRKLKQEKAEERDHGDAVKDNLPTRRWTEL